MLLQIPQREFQFLDAFLVEEVLFLQIPYVQVSFGNPRGNLFLERVDFLGQILDVLVLLLRVEVLGVQLFLELGVLLVD